MKKYYLIAIILIITTIGCEQDNICIDETTPDLVIRFYDYDDQTELKSVPFDSIWAEDVDLKLYVDKDVDSIALPIDINNDFTQYNLVTTDITDEIKFAYTRSDIFVGRSCGYKTIFEEFSVESNTSNWIKEIEIINTIIDNDTIAKIHIFH